MRRLKRIFLLGMLATISLFPFIAIADDDPEPVAEKKAPAPKAKLDHLKAEWEAVREQQIQMIREKEDQLEKLKEDIFAKMKAVKVPAVPQPEAAGAPGLALPPAVPDSSSELEAQRAAFQAERQKFFAEMNRQKENLRRLQSVLDEKAKRLEAERERFEQEKKTVAR